jgi:PAS domain S-box-containing protein
MGLLVLGERAATGAPALVYGVGLALWLLAGWRGAAVLAGSVGLAAGAWGLPAGTACVLAVAAAGVAGAGAWLSRKCCGGVEFLNSLENFARFTLGVVMGVPAVALLVTWLFWNGAAGADWASWLDGWLVYGLSAVTLTPLVVLLVTRPAPVGNLKRLRGLILLYVAAVGAVLVAFSGGTQFPRFQLLLACLPAPLVIVTALGFGPRETALLTTGMTALVLPAASSRWGLFAQVPAGMELHSAAAYLGTTSIMGLTTAILVAQRRRARRELEQANLELERRVAERTQQLATDNAARREAEAALQASEARARAQWAELDQIYRHAPVGLCVLDRELRFERVNAFLSRLTQRPAEDHTGKTLAAVSPGLALAMGDTLRRVLTGGEPILDFEFATSGAGEEPHRWLANFHPRRNEAGEVTGVFVAMTDITALRRVEEALRESEIQRERAEAFARTMVLHVGLDGRLQRVPASFCELLGYTAEELLQQSFAELTHPEDRARSLASLARLLRGEVPSVELEKRYLTRSGQVVWVHLDSTVVRDAAGRPLHLMTYVRDITRQKTAEAALQAAHAELEQRVAERTAELRRINEALRREVAQRQQAEAAHLQALSRLVDLQETERASLARELHDQLGQELNALNIGLALLHHHFRDLATLQDEVQRLQGLASHLVQAMHRKAWELRPPALDDFGLQVALQRYCTDFAQSSRLTVRFWTQNMEIERLPLRVETALYRVAQEALANVYFHARARTVNVLLQRHEQTVSLIVEDDGQGFNAEALRRRGDIRSYLGLLGMEERMLLIGGTLTVESQPGEGTTVLASVPVPLRQRASRLQEAAS